MLHYFLAEPRGAAARRQHDTRAPALAHYSTSPERLLRVLF